MQKGGCTTADEDPITGTFPRDQETIKTILEDIWEAAGSRDLDKLADFHLDTAKFTKWPSSGGGAIDFAGTIEEENELFSLVTDFEYEMHGLKIDVFGPVAIATFAMKYTVELGEQEVSGTEVPSL